MSYKHILVAVDESPMSYAAVEQALELAKDLNSRVTLMSVIAVDPFVGVDFYKVAPAITDYFLHAEKVAQDRLAEVKLSFDRDEIEVDTKVIRGISPSEGIIHVADEPSEGEMPRITLVSTSISSRSNESFTSAKRS